MNEEKGITLPASPPIRMSMTLIRRREHAIIMDYELNEERDIYLTNLQAIDTSIDVNAIGTEDAEHNDIHIVQAIY